MVLLVFLTIFVMYLPVAAQTPDTCASPIPAVVPEGRGVGTLRESLWPSGVRCKWEWPGGELEYFNGPGQAWNVAALIAGTLAIGFVLLPLLRLPQRMELG